MSRMQPKWEFKARFRRNAFGWRSQPAITRIKQAVSEIRRVARKDALLAAEGAVTFLERVSPAIEHVDGSSGAIGTAVNNAVRDLVPIIAGAPAEAATHAAWLGRLWEAYEADRIPYIESLADWWGELCVTSEVASDWADELLPFARAALSDDAGDSSYHQGTSACLSALFRAERYAEIIDIVKSETFWSYKCWGVKALAAMGRTDEAICCAEGSRGPSSSGTHIDALCEEIMLSSGLVDEAYERYGLAAHRAHTYLAWFRAVARTYPHKESACILADLVAITPGDEGKWFAAAKAVGLFDEAIALAVRSPCDPKTLIRAARDYAETEPAFARNAGTLALHWLAHGYGYEITGADVWAAYSHTMKAAENQGIADEARGHIRSIIADAASSGESFVGKLLGPELGL
jgi:hypothetical protein